MKNELANEILNKIAEIDSITDNKFYKNPFTIGILKALNNGSLSDNDARLLLNDHLRIIKDHLKHSTGPTEID